jgi:hypothetical protein
VSGLIVIGEKEFTLEEMMAEYGRLRARCDALERDMACRNWMSARIAELERECTRRIAEHAALETRIAHLERLGDAMSDELASIAGDGQVCGLCHVYSDHHKYNCSLSDVTAWRAFREGGK